MYTPRHFEESDPLKIASFLEQNPFGTLVSVVDGQALCSHLPFHFDARKGVLIAHMARANGQWESLQRASDVLVMFMGPNGYVSPTWYQSAGVPTWNYAAVHVRGQVELVEDPATLHDMVMDLTRRFETQSETPWNEGYDPRRLEHIVGFRIRISDIQAKFKLSQNRSAQERENVIAMLSNGQRPGDERLAAFMREQFASEGKPGAD